MNLIDRFCLDENPEERIALSQNITLRSNSIEYRVGRNKWERCALPPAWREFYEQQISKRITNRAQSQLDGEKFNEVVSGVRYRGQMGNSIGGWVISLRKVNQLLPNFADLHIREDDILPHIAPSGLHVIGGRVGSGKSTTLMALYNSLKDPGKTLDIGDPIETIIDRPYVDQREVGEHVSSYEKALYEAVRSCYDTVIISEIRDSKTAREALLAGSNGALILATVHADSVLGVLRRFEGWLPPEDKELLPGVLKFIVVQYLIPGKLADSQIPIYETLRMEKDVRNVLRDGVSSIPNIEIHQAGQSAVRFKDTIHRVYRNKLITDDQRHSAELFFGAIG